MTYDVQLDPAAKDFLLDADPPVTERIIAKIDEMKQKPTHFAKPMKGIDLWTLRVGDYRVLFDLYEDEEQIYINKIGHRKDIYRDLYE